MALQLLPVALAVAAGYLLFGKKAAASPAPSPYAPSPAPYVPPSPYTPPAPSSPDPGLYNVQPPSPGQAAPYVDPTSGLGVFPDAPGDTPIGPEAVATGTSADQSWLDSLSSFTTSGPALVWSDYVHGWVPYYAGHELGAPPPAGLPIF